MTIDEFKHIKTVAGFSTEELARYLGVSETQVRNYQTGRKKILKRTANQMLILLLLKKLESIYKELSTLLENP